MGRCVDASNGPWLLGREATPPSDAPEQSVQLDHGVPVYITYLTANVADGQLAFADDVYRLDPTAAAPTAIAAAEQAPSPAATLVTSSAPAPTGPETITH